MIGKFPPYTIYFWHSGIKGRSPKGSHKGACEHDILWTIGWITLKLCSDYLGISDNHTDRIIF